MMFVHRPHPLEMQRCCGSLMSLACYSGVIPLKFEIDITPMQISIFKDFVTLWNLLHSITKGVTIQTLYIRRHSSYHSSLSRALKNIVSSQSSLRKSQSLNDLSTSSSDCIGNYKSCPDLLEVQSLHNMHPKLRKSLASYMLYYEEQCDIKVIELKNHYKVHQ